MLKQQLYNFSSLVISIALTLTGQTVAQDTAASHKKMEILLADIAERSPLENIYIGQKALKDAELKLSEMDANTPDGNKLMALAKVGKLNLLAGNTDKAIQQLETVITTIENIAPQGYTKIHDDLVIAYLRQAENENCCAKPNPESCIFPLQGEAIHTQQEGSKKALNLILSKLPNLPKDDIGQKYRLSWLANIAAMTLGKDAEALPSDLSLPKSYTEQLSKDFPQFTNIAQDLGVDNYGLSGGSIADDFNGDGYFDIIVSDYNPTESLRFYVNKGDGTFVERTKSSNISKILGGLNIKQVDYDNDGDLDLYVMRGAWMQEKGRHPNSLLRNDGQTPDGGVNFTDVTFAVGLGNVHYPTQTCAWTDFDLDGDLDLFVGNESHDAVKYPCQLFRNDTKDGKVSFVDIAKKAGVNICSYVKGVTAGDYDGDRYPDIYISCFNAPNILYRNRGDGTFEDATIKAGTYGPISSFPTWFWDYNNDGHLDLFVATYAGTGSHIFKYAKHPEELQPNLCRLYENNGQGGFKRVEYEKGLTMPMLPMGCNYGDLANDGYQDMYLGTGEPDFSAVVPNIMLSNEAGTFVDRTVESRTGHLQKGHAVSFADFDRDGDLDIFEQMGGAYAGDPYYDALFQNPGNQNGWISIALRGSESNSYGVGARVRVVLKEKQDERSLYQWMNSGSSFGANPLELHFGLASATEILRVEVFWPKTGKTQIVETPEVNKRLVITER